MKSLFLAAFALILTPAVASAQDAAPYPHAQAVADDIVARNPDMLDVILHVSPTPSAANIVVAAHLRHANGEPSGEDDLGVMTTGAPLVEVQKDGVRIGVLVQMRDAGRHPIGAIGLMYPYKPGDDAEAVLKRSFAIRDALAAQTPSRDALVGMR